MRQVFSGCAVFIMFAFVTIGCCSVTDLRTERKSGEESGAGGTVTTTSATTTTTTTTTSSTTTSTDTSSGGGGAVNEGGTGGSAGEPPVATFSLAILPASGTIVKKSFNVPVVGIVITAGNEDITVPSITLTSQVEIAGSGCSLGEYCAREAAYTRMTSLAIWDDASQLGYAMSPDPATGRATIPNVDAVVAAGTSKTFVVRASFSSTASSAPFDHVAVGVENVWEIVVLDAAQQSVLGTLESDLQGQTGATPTVVHELRKSGTFSVVEDNQPSMTNIIAGKDVWVPFASYKACAEYEAVSFDFARIVQGSSMADDSDLTQIAVASGGSVHGTGILPVGATGAVDVYLSNGVITAPQDGCVSFQLWAKTADVLPSSVTGGQSGLPMSGHAPALGITDSVATGEWSSEYTGYLNLRSTGVTSAEHALAATGASMGNMMVLRKSVPTITKLPLASTILANTDMDLIKFQVAADDAGPVALKSMFFGCNPTPHVNISNVRLRRGMTDLPVESYSVLGGVKKANPPPPYCMFQIRFLDEEIVNGPGYVYTVHAMISGATAGESLWFGTMPSKYYYGVDPFVPTGQLSEYMLVGLGGFVSIADMYSNEVALPGLSWSDMSEEGQHNANVGGSVDWTSDILVEGWTMGQTLAI